MRGAVGEITTMRIQRYRWKDSPEHQERRSVRRQRIASKRGAIEEGLKVAGGEVSRHG